MNFSSEDRKEVFFFFKEILSSYNAPVYYENIRGHVSHASPTVRRYVLTKCKGDQFFEYFKRRRNYFSIENGYIALKKEFGCKQGENSGSNKPRKKKTDWKNFKRSASFSSSSKSSASIYNSYDGEYEDISINYFRNRLIRKKKERLSTIEFNDLPKKVLRHIQLNHKNKVRNFFSFYSNIFVIDLEDNVSLAQSNQQAKSPDSSIGDRETCADSIDETCADSIDESCDSAATDPEIQAASDYLECIVFFIAILRKVQQPFPVEKLGGYLSQARKGVKEHLKWNYRSFKFFFDDAPLIFVKNGLGEVFLSERYRKLLKDARTMIDEAQNGEVSSVMPLKSRINYILQPQVISQCAPQYEQTETGSGEGSSEEVMRKQESPCEVISEFESHAQVNRGCRNATLAVNHKQTLKKGDTVFSPPPARDDPSRMNEMEFDSMQNSEDVYVFKDQFLKCVFTIELFCLEFVENEINFIKSYEIKAVKYFEEVLDDFSKITKVWRLSSLHGSLGNSPEIARFMNKYYKAEKFPLFFQKHPQFKVDDPFISLVSSEQSSCIEVLDSSSEKKSKEYFQNIYESCRFQKQLKETYCFLNEACKFLHNKSRTKLDRLTGVLSRFPNCLDMIKSLEGQSLTEKTETFLRTVGIFEFFNDGCISLPDCSTEKHNLIFKWFEKMQELSKDSPLKFESASHFWKEHFRSSSCSTRESKYRSGSNYLVKKFETITDIIENAIAEMSALHYFHVVQMIERTVLLAITELDKDSRFIIYALLDSERFVLENGKINMHSSSAKSDAYDYNASVPTSITDNHHIVTELERSVTSRDDHDDHKTPKDLVIQLSDNCNVGKNDSIKYSKVPTVALKCDLNSPSDVPQVNLSNENNADEKENDSGEEKTVSKLIENQSNLLSKNNKGNSNPSLVSDYQDEHSIFANENDISGPSKESMAPISTDEGMTLETSRKVPSAAIDLETVVKHPVSEVMENKSEELSTHEKKLDSIYQRKASSDVDEVNDKEFDNLSLEEFSVLESHVNWDANSLVNDTDKHKDFLTTTETQQFEERDPCLNRDQMSTPACEDMKSHVSDVEICESKTVLQASKHSTELFEDEMEFIDDQTSCSQSVPNSVNLDTSDINSPKKPSISVKPTDTVLFETEEKVKGLQGNLNGIAKTVTFVNGIRKPVLETLNEEQGISANSEELLSFEAASCDNRISVSASKSADTESEIEKNKNQDECFQTPCKILTKYFESETSEVSATLTSPANLKIKSDRCTAPQVVDFGLTESLSQFEGSTLSVSPISLSIVHSEQALDSALNSCVESCTEKCPVETPEDFLISSSFAKETSTKTARKGANDGNSLLRNEEYLEPLSRHIPEIKSSSLTSIKSLEHFKKLSQETEVTNEESCKYPMQPIAAKIILLTSDSCIAAAEIESRKQSIYFLKCAFLCDHLDDCIDCFNALQIDDEVSCCVPLTELSHRMWIAFIVSKDKSQSFDACKNLQKLDDDVKIDPNVSVCLKSVSIQTESSAIHHGCQTEFSACDNCSETHHYQDLKLRKQSTKESACETNLVAVNSVSSQTEIASISSHFLKKSTMTQTRTSDDIKKCVYSKNMTCQTSFYRSFKEFTNNVGCQTFSTGPVMMLEHHPL